jgi:methionine-rich copper-binding protein CopC
VGNQVNSPPTHVKIWFTERLEPALSKIQVFDSSGQQVDKGNVQADKSDPMLLSVSLPALRPGKYKVVWRVVSVDTQFCV